MYSDLRFATFSIPGRSEPTFCHQNLLVRVILSSVPTCQNKYLVVTFETEMMSLHLQLRFGCLLVIYSTFPLPYFAVMTLLRRACGIETSCQICFASRDLLQYLRFFSPNPPYHANFDMFFQARKGIAFPPSKFPHQNLRIKLVIFSI